MNWGHVTENGMNNNDYRKKASLCYNNSNINEAFLLYLKLFRHASAYYLQNNLSLCFAASKGGFYYESKKF